MLDAVVSRIAEVAGPWGVRAFEWVGGAVRVEIAASLVSAEGIAEKADVKDAEKAGKGGGEGSEVVQQEGERRQSGRCERGDGRRNRDRKNWRWTWGRGENDEQSLCRSGCA